MPDHLMGLLLLVGTTKERERQDCNRHPDCSPYGNPTFLVLRTPTLCLMAVLLFKAVCVKSVLGFVVRVRYLEVFGRYFGFLGRYSNVRCLRFHSLGHQLHEDPKVG